MLDRTLDATVCFVDTKSILKFEIFVPFLSSALLVDANLAMADALF